MTSLTRSTSPGNRGPAARSAECLSREAHLAAAADPAGGERHLDPGYPPETVRELVSSGHRVTAAASTEFGGYQAIWYDAEKEVYFGATESRKDGVALGY